MMGCRLTDICESVGQLSRLAEACVAERYLIGPYRAAKRGHASGRVGVVLHESASALDELKAYMHATSLLEELAKAKDRASAVNDEVSLGVWRDLSDPLGLTLKFKLRCYNTNGWSNPRPPPFPPRC